MAKYIINGPCENFGGNVKISGSKNSALPIRSEERRVGKECRSRWSPYH